MTSQIHPKLIMMWARAGLSNQALDNTASALSPTEDPDQGMEDAFL